MRNLRIINSSAWKIAQEFSNRTITATVWDLANDAILCTFGPTESDALIELVRVKENTDNTGDYKLITSWDAPCPNLDLSCDQILNLQFFADTLTTCLVLAGGDIVVVREDPQPGEDKIEIVGSVDAGITAARWSPDEELLAIATKADTVVFMSRSFEGIKDVEMTSEDLKASNHVSVGWGKKETQFKGKGAKALRDPTMPEKIDEGTISTFDTSEVTISWRGDGAFLAISSIEGGIRRLIRVYSREGELDSVSEPVNGLEGALSWRPTGNLLAGIQRIPDRIDVVFFERNGLRHGQFSLRLTPEEQNTAGRQISLHWNSDSSVLAVCLLDRIQLWIMGNYHWYLKQEIFRSPSSSSSHSMPLVWHIEKALKLTYFDEGTIFSSEYAFTVSRGSTVPPNDYGAVAVIDGRNLKVTPFRTSNSPPPFSTYVITVASNMIDAAFSSDPPYVAVLHHLGLSLFQWQPESKRPVVPTCISTFEFTTEELGTNMKQQICFNDSNAIQMLQRDNNLSTSRIRSFRFQVESAKLSELTLNPLQSSSAKSLHTIYGRSSLKGGTQDHQGIVHCKPHGKIGGGEYTIKPGPLPLVEVAETKGSYIVFSLSLNGTLFANYKLLAKGCTSFVVTPAHLIFTTNTHFLKFVHLTDIEDLDVPADTPEKDERCRSIERGARLVTAIPTTLSLVLQMPRGNLETIWPRAMVVAGIRDLIDGKKYGKAFAHCRTQRVDMNILYDHAPIQFMSSVDLFIEQVKKISYIDLFLSSLREEDVTETMYKETRVKSEAIEVNGSATIQVPPENMSKINKICDAFLNVLKKRKATNLQNIITAYVCKSPPALDDGLLVVAGLMEESDKLAEKAVEHICFLADVNKLYDYALGLYKLDLALLVAQQSQKDPREYLPFMQNLQQMTKLRRRYSIDDHLGRHGKALSHLHQLDAVEELRAYTVKHDLYNQALSLYRYNEPQLRALTSLYGKHLEATSQFREAGLAYESIGDYAQATPCYQSALLWRECLFSASQQQTPPLSRQALAELAAALADALQESKNSSVDAAIIRRDYLDDPAAAIRLFCRASAFNDALVLVGGGGGGGGDQGRSRAADLLPVFDAALAEALSAATEFLAECKAQLAAQVPRVLELRQKALLDPLAFYEGQAQQEDIPDDVSVAASSRASTSRSLLTRYTGPGSTAGSASTRATSKNRRREEKKRARGKKGSVYEQEYLVASVGRLVRRVEGTRVEVRALVEALVRRGMRERAGAVEALMVEVVEACAAAVEVVFRRQLQQQEQEQEQGNLLGVGRGFGGEDGTAGGVRPENYRAVGGEAVLQESMEEAGRPREVPFIGSFAKLSLLGS